MQELWEANFPHFLHFAWPVEWKPSDSREKDQKVAENKFKKQQQLSNKDVCIC